MANFKSNYFLIVLFFIVSTLFVQCKNQSEKAESTKEDLVVSADIQKSNLSKPKFNYNDLVNKTFLPVQLKGDGSYQYHGDISKEYDMGEDRIRFKRNKIMHLKPIEWYDFYIHKKKYDSDWLQINLLGHYDYQNKDTTNQFLYYFKYDKEKNLLFFSDRRTNDHLEIFMDSAFIAKKEKHKSITENDNPLKKYVVNKRSKILIGNKNIEIELPFINEYIDEHGEKQFGENQIPNEIEAKLLKSPKGEILYLFGEERCALCPSFSAIYKLNGENLTYRYTRRKGQEMIVLLSEEEESKVLKNYGFVGNEFLIQFNHSDTPTYIIKDWY